MLASDIRLALAGTKTRVLTAIAGLGGRPITKRSLRDLFSRAERGELDELTFLDLSSETIQRELHSQNQRGSETPQRSAAQEQERRAQCLPSL